MTYLTEEQLFNVGFKKIGQNVKISVDARIYDADRIELGSNVRIDDFCLLSGKLIIGSYVHITPYCLLAGGIPGIFIDDFCTLAYGVKVFSQSDDYSGQTMTNSLIPKRFKNEKLVVTHCGKYSIIGAGSVVLPGCNIAEGVAVGAMSLVHRPTQSWSIYGGTPAKRLGDRSKNLIEIAKRFAQEHDSF